MDTKPSLILGACVIVAALLIAVVPRGGVSSAPPPAEDPLASFVGKRCVVYYHDQATRKGAAETSRDPFLAVNHSCMVLGTNANWVRVKMKFPTTFNNGVATEWAKEETEMAIPREAILLIRKVEN